MGQVQRSGVPAVTHALNILELFQETQNRPMTMTTIAKTLGINGSTCFNILKTLEARSYLSFEPDTKEYRLEEPAVVGAMEPSHGMGPSDALDLLGEVTGLPVCQFELGQDGMLLTCKSDRSRKVPLPTGFRVAPSAELERVIGGWVNRSTGPAPAVVLSPLTRVLPSVTGLVAPVVDGTQETLVGLLALVVEHDGLTRDALRGHARALRRTATAVLGRRGWTAAEATPGRLKHAS